MEPHPDLTTSVIFGLGVMYLLQFIMNVCWTFRSFKKDGHVRIFGHELPVAALWASYSATLFMVAAAHLTISDNADKFLLRLPVGFRDVVNAIVADPKIYSLICVILFALMIFLRNVLNKPTAGWVLLNASLLFLTLSMTDYDFRQIVGKPDNVPIVAMLFIVGYFTWLYFHCAEKNDLRTAAGKPLVGNENNEKVLVWPDLVYTELICMISVTAFLIIWGIFLQAPLEEPASLVKTPNPSKAPWYFLGLQEMLVYYDPWLAGVVFPSLILGGLMTIPYIDFNKKGNGYYTFEERKFSVSVFMFGFIPMWIGMIILGTFLRGPNWNTFGIYEFWDVHKLEALNNVNLSEYFWLEGLGRRWPVAAKGDSAALSAVYILIREAPGFILIGLYLGFLPLLLAGSVLKSFFRQMGFIRYMVFSNMLLMMAALPIKMLLRWAFNLKYVVAIPEWFFNI